MLRGFATTRKVTIGALGCQDLASDCRIADRSRRSSEAASSPQGADPSPIAEDINSPKPYQVRLIRLEAIS